MTTRRKIMCWRMSFALMCLMIGMMMYKLPTVGYAQVPPGGVADDSGEFIEKTPTLIPPDSIKCSAKYDIFSITPNYIGFHLYKQNAKGEWESVYSVGQVGGVKNPGTYSNTLEKVAKGTYKVRLRLESGTGTKVEFEAKDLITVP